MWLLAGKAISGAIIGFVTMLVAFTFAIIVFKVRIAGSVPGFLAIAAAFAVMASTFGLLIASIGQTPGGTRGVAILATLIMVMLGGAWVPAFIFPAWLQQATLVIPVRWAVDGLDAMTWRGLGIGAAVMPTLVLLGFAAGLWLAGARALSVGRGLANSEGTRTAGLRHPDSPNQPGNPGPALIPDVLSPELSRVRSSRSR